jgi:hypothetical protein
VEIDPYGIQGVMVGEKEVQGQNSLFAPGKDYSVDTGWQSRNKPYPKIH